MGVWPALQDTLAGDAKAITGGVDRVLRDLRVNGKLTMGQGGLFRTASSGQRIELTNTDKNFIHFYSGDVGEVTAGRIALSVSGSGVTRTIQFSTRSPQIDADDWKTSLVNRSGSPDGSTFAPAVVISRVTGGGADTGLNPEVRIQNGIKVLSDGTATFASTDTSVGEPIMSLHQADVDEDFFKFVGTSDTNVDRALVDAANFTTPGSIAGWLKILVFDDQSSSPIADGDYYLPFYTAPTA